MSGHEHHVNALDRIEEVIHPGNPEKSRLWTATIASAEAQLAIYDVLVDIKHELERLSNSST